MNADSELKEIFDATNEMSNTPLPHLPLHVITKEDMIRKFICQIQIMSGEPIWLPDEDFWGTLEDLVWRKCNLGSLRSEGVLKKAQDLQITWENIVNYSEFLDSPLIFAGVMSIDEGTEFLSGAKYIRLYNQLQLMTNEKITEMFDRFVALGKSKKVRIIDQVNAVFEKELQEAEERECADIIESLGPKKFAALLHNVMGYRELCRGVCETSSGNFSYNEWVPFMKDVRGFNQSSFDVSHTDVSQERTERTNKIVDKHNSMIDAINQMKKN